MNEYNPDRWVIVKFVGKDKTWYKVLGSWYGGYVNGDSWRMSSGLEKIEEDGDNYLMRNVSGSVYKVNQQTSGMSMYTSGIYYTVVEQGKENGVEVSMIDVDQFNRETKENPT